jgi:hypothetical protein
MARGRKKKRKTG